MDILYFSLCFIALFASSFGQDPPLAVTFENMTRVDAVEGTEMVYFKCHVNRGAMFVLRNKVEIIHIHPLTKEETILSSAGDLQEGKPAFYDVKIDSHPDKRDHMVVDFIIKKVRYQDDGIFKCHVHSGGKGDSSEDAFIEREVVVHRPFSSLTLKIGDFDPLTESLNDPFFIDHGNYKVACIAEGSNPSTEEIHLYFDGNPLEHSENFITAMSGPDRMFKTEINGTLNLVVSNSGKKLVCQAEDSTGQSKTVFLIPDINVYDPVVFCNDTEAHIGQDNPTIICTVNYTDQEVDGYSYQIGDSGRIFKEGDQNEDNVVVSVSNVAPGVSVVALDLHKAQEMYLDKDYYLLIDLVGGHSVREKVRLSKKEAPVTDKAKGNNDGGNQGGEIGGDPGHGVRLSPATLLCVFMCVAAFWSSH